MRSMRAVVVGAVLGLGSIGAAAEDALTRTVAALHQERADLAGKTVRVEGKVVKVNNGIMGRNFLHLQDGTGDATTNDLTVTSKQTAAVGDKVAITGKVVVGRDFGSGYSYPLLLEEATIAPAK